MTVLVSDSCPPMTVDRPMFSEKRIMVDRMNSHFDADPTRSYYRFTEMNVDRVLTFQSRTAWTLGTKNTQATYMGEIELISLAEPFLVHTSRR